MGRSLRSVGVLLMDIFSCPEKMRMRYQEDLAALNRIGNLDG